MGGQLLTMRLDGGVTHLGPGFPPWTVIMPVKPLALAKSRLAGSSAVSGAVLAEAFFQDALDAVLACPLVGRVVVATTDPRIAAYAGAWDCIVVPDGDHPGINEAARFAARHAPEDAPVAVVVSDLPCLTPSSMAATLSLAAEHRTAFLADSAGTGTTMWLAAPGVAVASQFGSDSAAAHRAAGHTDLAAGSNEPSELEPARLDVDIESDLDGARRLGLGAHTRVALDRPTVAECIVTVMPADSGTAVPAVREDGSRLRIPLDVATLAGFRALHPGQRLVVRTDRSGVVTSARLP